MSLVVFPFKDEPVEVVARNIEIATRHDAIQEIWGVAAVADEKTGALDRIARDLSRSSGTGIRIISQGRIGEFRPGKGDAMNTAIHLAAEEQRKRVHFYDADITNFDGSWIEGAERAADRGFGVVRHRFPRAATDAMITWFITRPGLAILFPGTFLPRLNQPLGGELLLTGDAVQRLASNPFVAARSDWGIDTVLTHAVSVMDIGLYEHHVQDGKRHALYGSLSELRTMLLECVDAVASLSDKNGPRLDARYGSDPDQPVPEDLKQLVGYDVDTTKPLVTAELTGPERELRGRFPDQIDDSATWFEVIQVLLRDFDLNHEGWRDLTFRLWLMRVLAYTTNQALAGFDSAMAYLEGTIREYESR